MTIANVEIGILGTGSMGTAIGILTSRNGYTTRIAGEAPVLTEIQRSRQHPFFFQDTMLPNPIIPTPAPKDIALKASIIFVCMPSREFRYALQQLQVEGVEEKVVIAATKGLEPRTGLRMTEIIAEELPGCATAALLGPNVTSELVDGLPTELIFASDTPQRIQHSAAVLTRPHIRVEVREGLQSLEYVGALKNIVTLSVGVSVGLELGFNFASVVFVKVLDELKVLGSVLGIEESDFYGGAGLSDILTTCLCPFSKNFQVGVELGAGKPLIEIHRELQANGHTAEGLNTMKEAFRLYQVRDLNLHILDVIYRFIYNNVSRDETKERLLREVLEY